MTMYNYAKSILKAVSFDSYLFEKELRKLSKWMSPEEATNLVGWCKENFDIELLMKVGILNF